MKHSLSLISFLLLFCCLSSIAQVVTDGEQYIIDSITVKEFSLGINIRGHKMTGICIIGISADSCIVGAIVNEFGIKLFDFSYFAAKTKIFNIIDNLDKWYIRKVLRNDFRFILSNMFINDNVVSEKKRTMKKLSDGGIIVENSQHKICYTFLLLTEKNETKK